MKNISTVLLCFCILTLSNYSSFGQSAIDKKYPAAELKQDLVMLKSNLEAIHAGLYTYTTKAEYDTFFQELSNSITEPMNSQTLIVEKE